MKLVVYYPQHRIVEEKEYGPQHAKANQQYLTFNELTCHRAPLFQSPPVGDNIEETLGTTISRVKPHGW